MQYATENVSATKNCRRELFGVIAPRNKGSSKVSGVLRCVCCRHLLLVRDDHLWNVSVHYDGCLAHVLSPTERLSDAELGKFIIDLPNGNVYRLGLLLWL